ncbi:MAG TPA: hypothetical protein VKX28_01555 [Xanthobacteraceae bacterium]|nr:hypothetical protein [Xanthobacteraceae bacterium]
MNWWRSRRRCGAGLGLLALLVQNVLAFGHIHPEDFQPATARPMAALAHQSPSQPDTPPGQPDDHCPICMAVQLAAVGVVSTPPVVALPSEFVRVTHSATVAREISVARYVLFRTRAPPIA